MTDKAISQIFRFIWVLGALFTIGAMIVKYTPLTPSNSFFEACGILVLSLFGWPVILGMYIGQFIK